jgi:hypothetical protein
VDETRLMFLREEVALREAELACAVEVWRQGDPAMRGSQGRPRERWRLERAQILARLAAKRLAEAEAIRAAEIRREAVMARRREQFAPPDLQALVLAHGTYDKITLEAWAGFGADMAEWKGKIRAGEHGDENFLLSEVNNRRTYSR